MAKPDKFENRNSKIENLYNVRISGQVEAGSIEDAIGLLTDGLRAWDPSGPKNCFACNADLKGQEKFCPKCSVNLGMAPAPAPLLEGGILRITPADS